MTHSLQLDIDKLPRQIGYHSSVLLIGSCFTENMSQRLAQHRFRVLDNPHGILFNPISVANSLDSYIHSRLYKEDDLFLLNEVWNSWEHHSDFSDISKTAALEKINRSQQQAAEFIRTATHVFITLGSAFYYELAETGKAVSNNHRAPAQWFEKRLMTCSEITARFANTISEILMLNPDVQVVFTVSPVRHVRDGVVQNNRSKARLIDAVHELCSMFPQVYYFPAYELVIDILRDYRYYDIDFVHPNFLATNFVWDELVKACMNGETQAVMKEVGEIAIARAHKPRFPQTEAHRKFREIYVHKIEVLMAQHPYLNLEEELAYFKD